MSALARIGFGSAIGVAYYLVLNYLIGFPETLSYPDWFIQHADEGMLAAEFRSSLVYFTLPIVAISAVFGVLVSKTVTHRRFAVGSIAVGIAILLGIAKVMPEYGLLKAIQLSMVPANWIDLPAYLAFYLTLPIVSFVAGDWLKLE